MIKKEEVSFLNQLIKSMEEAEISLEEAYQKKDYDNFNKSKKIMLRIQKQIADMIK